MWHVGSRERLPQLTDKRQEKGPRGRKEVRTPPFCDGVRAQLFPGRKIAIARWRQTTDQCQEAFAARVRVRLKDTIFRDYRD